MTAGAMGGDATVPDLEEGTDFFASLRPLTEGPIFNGLQVASVQYRRLFAWGVSGRSGYLGSC